MAVTDLMDFPVKCQNKSRPVKLCACLFTDRLLRQLDHCTTHLYTVMNGKKIHEVMQTTSTVAFTMNSIYQSLFMDTQNISEPNNSIAIQSEM